MDFEPSEILIVGGRPCGLGSATHLRELDISKFKILDSCYETGGLTSSFVNDQGFTWDIGGHAQFSYYQYFDDAKISFLGEDGWLTS
jgi:protoporphyrinogen oxidase